MRRDKEDFTFVIVVCIVHHIVEQTISGSCFNFFHISNGRRRAEETPHLVLAGAYLCLHALYGLAFMLLLYFFSFVKKYGMCLPSFIRRTNHKMLLMMVKKMATVLRSWPIFFLFKYIKIYHGWLYVQYFGTPRFHISIYYYRF